MRLLSTTAITSCLAALIFSASGALAQSANTTPSNDNILNLLSPFLSLNSTAIGQQTLSSNLSQALATNHGATLVQEEQAISDKSILSSASNTSTLSAVGLPNYGVAANLAGGLPAQTVDNGITPQQPVGGLGSVLGPIYQTGVASGTTGPLSGTVALLVAAYGETSTDLGVAKFYFANGTTNGTATAVAATGYSVPTANGLPNTANSVYDLAYGVTNTQSGQNSYGDSRPVQVTPSGVNVFDPTALSGLTTNPSFPSGHTTYAYTDSTLLAMLVPQDFGGMLLRAASYANSRIVLGVHYPLDIIASRALAFYDLSNLLSNPLYINNAATTGTAVNTPALFNTAYPQIQSYLATQCGASVQTCVNSVANTNNDPYTLTAANLALYQSEMTYGLPTLTYAQAPREAAPSGGVDASILLATLYGGSTSAALTIAPSGGTLASLQTGTINQIIVNTEGNALAAFYGTSLSYWTRINLVSASVYFSDVIGTLVTAPTDSINTPVTVASTGDLDDNGTITQTTAVNSGGTLSGSGSATAAVTVNSGGTLAPGSLAAQTALLAGTTGVTGTSLNLSAGLTLASGSTLSITASPSQATSVVSTSTVSIGGAAVALQTGTNQSYAPATYTILSATGGVTGTFSGASASNLPFLTTSLSYDAHDAYLSLSTNTAALAAAAVTPNEANVAQALIAAQGAPSSAGNALVNGIFSVSSAAKAQAAFNAISGEGYSSVKTSNAEAGHAFISSISDQATLSMTGAGGATNAITLTDAPSGVLGYAATAKTRSPITVSDPAPAPARTFRAWAIGFGNGLNIDANSNSSAVSGNSYGGVAGLDYQVNPDLLIGVSIGGSSSSVSVGSLATSASITGIHGGLYALDQFAQFYTAETFTVSGFSNQTTRIVQGFAGVPGATEKASFGSTDIRGRFEFGRNYHLGATAGFANVTVTPFVAIEAADLHSNGFSEYNVAGGANTLGLTANSQDQGDVPGFLGARLNSVLTLQNNVILRPWASVAYVHDFVTPASVTNSFAALPGSSFTVTGATIARNLAETKLGFELDVGKGVALFANFDGDFASSERSYGGKGGINYTW